MIEINYLLLIAIFFFLFVFFAFIIYFIKQKYENQILSIEKYYELKFANLKELSRTKEENFNEKITLLEDSKKS